MSKILIVEDEQQIARVLELELSFEGYETVVTHTGTDGLLAFHEQEVDLILLDVMLPEMNGLEVLKRIRKHNEMIPVILLTAKGEIQDKVTGLDYGANDYITKPFEFDELLARIRVALRFSTKAPQTNEQQMTFEDLQLNEQTREVWRGGNLVELTPREFDLLVHLMKHPKLVQSREQLLNTVWGYDYFGSDRVVDNHIKKLRKALGNAGSQIKTVITKGYKLTE